MSDETEPEIGWLFLDATLPGRSSVRESLSKPVLRFLNHEGTSVRIPLNEPQLLALLKDVAEVLERMRIRREYAKASDPRCPFCGGPLATERIHGSVDGTPATEFTMPGMRYCASDCGYGTTPRVSRGASNE